MYATWWERMAVDQVIQYLINHKDKPALAIKSSFSCIWLFAGDILKSLEHLTLRHQHTDILGMMVSLLLLWHQFYGQPFLREQIISNLYWRAQLSEHFSVKSWLQTYSKLPLLRASSYRQPDTILKTLFFFFPHLKWQVLKIRVPKGSRKKSLTIFLSVLITSAMKS